MAMFALANLPANLKAQSTFGSVRGTTQDATGAVITQVRVTLHSVDENTDAAVLSDGTGSYLFENVKPGHYRLTTAREGFANSIVDNVDLASRQDIRVDLKLAIASTNTEIEVSAEAAAVNTETPRWPIPRQTAT